MYKEIQAIVTEEKPQGTILRVLVPSRLDDIDLDRFAANGIIIGELRIDDRRCISADQRKKAYATIADIALHTGYLPEQLKEIMKYMYIAKTGADYFSLSDCSVTTARLFINFLIDFALEWNIPLMDLVLNRTDDINAAIYASIKHCRCIICGQEGEIHHYDAIGMGRNRNTVDDSNYRKICLCRKHHDEAHIIGRISFEEKYHCYGMVYKE